MWLASWMECNMKRFFRAPVAIRQMLGFSVPRWRNNYQIRNTEVFQKVRELFTDQIRSSLDELKQKRQSFYLKKHSLA